MSKDAASKANKDQTYRLGGVTAEDGTLGTLVLTVKPGGNAHAEFEAGVQESPPEAQQLPAEPGPETPEGDQPQAGQLPAQEE